MKRILLIQSRLHFERAAREEGEFRRALTADAELSCISALDENMPWNEPGKLLRGYDAVLIGGSGDFHLHGGDAPEGRERTGAQEILARFRPLTQQVFTVNFPVLGICFGHQLLAEIMGGGVTHDHLQKKTGTFEVCLTEEGKADHLFGQLPPAFFAQYAHKDSVTTLPRGAALMATGDACRFSALRYGPRAYSTQFHPEATKNDMVATGQMMRHYVPQGIEPEDLFRDSPEASSLIRLFIETTVA